ncbi:hypothetical protein BTO02_23845 [Paraburkholderia sp. SOS3]|nr:hypothetical protein BTO02_23845 [Paraburkholderia sp. SOS3]
MWTLRANLEFADTSGYDPASTMEKCAPPPVELIAQAGRTAAMQGRPVALPFLPWARGRRKRRRSQRKSDEPRHSRHRIVER